MRFSFDRCRRSACADVAPSGNGQRAVARLQGARNSAFARREAEPVGARAENGRWQAGSQRHLERRRPDVPLQHRPGPAARRRSAVGGGALPAARQGVAKGQPARPVHAGQPPVSPVLQPDEARANADADGGPARVAEQPQSDCLPRRPRSPKDPESDVHGVLVGKWEGDTLVVTTAGFNDKGWLDSAGHPQTESLRITERYHRRDFGHMEWDITIDDPKAFTKAFTIKTRADAAGRHRVARGRLRERAVASSLCRGYQRHSESGRRLQLCRHL